jgi:predicted DNA-binding protein
MSKEMRSNLRLPAELKERLRIAAEQDERSEAQAIRLGIKMFCDRVDEEHGIKSAKLAKDVLRVRREFK